MRSRLPSTTRTCTRAVSPGKTSGTSSFSCCCLILSRIMPIFDTPKHNEEAQCAPARLLIFLPECTTWRSPVRISVKHRATLTGKIDKCYIGPREGRRLSPQTSTDREHGRSGLALAGAIGGNVVACLVIGLIVGVVLDRLLHTSPLFLICGVVLGFAASFFLTYRLAMREMGD